MKEQSFLESPTRQTRLAWIGFLPEEAVMFRKRELWRQRIMEQQGGVWIGCGDHTAGTVVLLTTVKPAEPVVYRNLNV